jgi:hypothetical protein
LALTPTTILWEASPDADYGLLAQDGMSRVIGVGDASYKPFPKQ